MSTVPMLDNYIFFINIQHSYYNYLVLTVLDTKVHITQYLHCTGSVNTVDTPILPLESN